MVFVMIPKKSNIDVSIKIGQRIEQFRTDLNFDLTETAAYLGVNRNTLRRYELGTSLVPLEVILKCSELFCIPVFAFYKGLTNDDFSGFNNIKSRVDDLEKRVQILEKGSSL